MGLDAARKKGYFINQSRVRFQMQNSIRHKNVAWIASLYIGQSLPYVVITVLATILYKSLHMQNGKIAFYTSLFFLPWSLKPLWAPLFEIHFTKKDWLLRLQMFEVFLFFGIGLLLFNKAYFIWSVPLFLLLGFCSASYDIVSDGLYMISLSTKEQYQFVGIRSLFYQLGRFFIQGALLILVGYLSKHFSVPLAWQACFFLLSIIILILAFWHAEAIKEDEKPNEIATFQQTKVVSSTFKIALTNFLTLPHLGLTLLFLFFFNANEAQVLKILPLFLLDRIQYGGLGLDASQIGIAYGLSAGIALIAGVSIGGIIVTRFGLSLSLRRTTLLMAMSTSCYYLLSCLKTPSLWWPCILIAIPQFFYGLANSAYMSFILKQVSKLSYRTSCYAICTAIMSLSYLFFGSFSGYEQQWLGYRGFFIAVFCFSSVICAVSFKAACAQQP